MPSHLNNPKRLAVGLLAAGVAFFLLGDSLRPRRKKRSPSRLRGRPTRSLSLTTCSTSSG